MKRRVKMPDSTIRHRSALSAILVLYQPYQDAQGQDVPVAVSGEHRCRMGTDWHEGIRQSRHLESGKRPCQRTRANAVIVNRAMGTN